MRVAADGIIYRVEDKSMLLIKRKYPPFQNKWALPGGMVDEGETVENALIREMKEELTIDVQPQSILGVYSDPNRDPRGQVISVVFVASWDETQEPRANDDAKECQWLPISELHEDMLAFDHFRIISDFKQWLKDKTQTFWSSKSDFK